MAEEVLDEALTDGPGPGQPGLADEHRAKLDSIVQQMIKNKESDSDIQMVVNDFKQKYSTKTPDAQLPKPAPTAFKPMTDWLAFPEAAQPMVQDNAINDHNTKVAQAKERVNAHLGDIDNSVHNLIHEHKQDLQGRIVSEQLGLNPKEVGPINPQAQQLESQLRQGITVAPKEISDFKTGMATDPAMARMALNQKAKDLAKKDPNAAKQLKGDLYRIDRQNDPSKDNKISENIDKINSGEYDYDITHGQLVKPQGFLGSLVTGYKEKVDAFDDYDVYKTGDKDAILKRINERTKYDPDKAIPVSEEGWLSHPLGEMGRAFGGLPLKPLIAGAIAGRLGPQAGAAATAAVSVPEMYKLTFGSALPHNYDALKKQNPTLSEEEVLQKAIDLTDKQANTDAAVAGAMGGLGAKAGFEPTGLKNTLLQKSLRSALGQIGQEGLKKTIEGLGVGAIGAGGQYIKNVMAQKAGIPTDETEGMAQQLWSGVGMTMMMTIAAKTPELLKPKTYNQFFQAVKDVPTETIQHHLDNLKEAGQITEEQAQAFNKSLEEHKALDNSIKTHVPESDRLKVQELIKERDQLKAGLETEDEAYRSETNEKIKALNERINNVSKGQDRGELQQFVDEAFKNEDIKRSTTDDFRNASENDLKKHFKEIARLAHDPNTEAGMRDTFGDDIVNKAKELYPQEPPKESKISVIQPGEIKQPETITIAPKEEIKPVSENIQPNKEFQTMNMGKDEGQPETKEAREQMKARMVQGDVPIDGEGGKGETGRGFAGRVLSAWENLKKSGDHNTSLITHSSVLKAIKTWENSKTWEGIEKPTDPTLMNNEQWKRFADEFNKERTENGDLETFKGDKGDIHVIRHGQTEDNKLNKFRSGNTNLTEEGIQQAHDVGKRLQEKTGGNVPQIITSDLPRAVHTSNIIHENLKPTENAIPIGSTAEIHVGETPGDSQPVGEGVSQSGEITGTQEGQSKEEGNAPSKEKVMASSGGGNLVGISHDALNDLAQRLGLPQIERGQVRTPEEYAQMGREILRQGVDPNTVLNSHLEPHEKASVARAYLEEMVKNADAISDKSSAQYRKELQDIADFNANVVKKLGTEWAELGRALQGRRDLDTDSFTAVSLKITDETGKPLTSEQAQKIKELTEKNKELQSRLDNLDAKLIKDTDADLGKETKTTSAKEPKAKKTHDQYVKERKDAFDAARNALKKLRRGGSGLGVSIVPGGRHLSAIAPHIGKIVRSFVEEGVNKLGDIVDAIHDELSKDIIGLRRRDVIDLIAGKYDNKETVKTNESTEIRKQSRLVAKLEDLQNGLPEDFDKNKTEQSPAVKKLLEQIKKVKKDLADMGYMASKKDEPLSAEEKNIRRLEKELEDLKQGIVKQKSPSRELTDKEIELKEQIKDEREKLGLVSSKEKKPLTEQEIQDQHEADIKSIQEQFINKKGDKFTHDEAKSIWGYMKENYLDKGVKFRDAIEQVSNDTGLSFEQISNAIVTPKTKRISEARWKQQYDLQKNRLATKRYVDAQNENPFIKAYKKITAARRSESIFGHAGVFIGTHAGMTLFDLPRAKYTIKAFLNAYKFGYGKIANYEKSMEGLKKRKYYELAQRANLKNNPDIIDNDAEITKPFLSKYLGKFMESGKRGYNAMKILRQDLFDAHYDELSDIEKADPGSAVRIAELVNNATGATNLDLMVRNKQGDVVFDPNEVAFAPGMETARWGKLIRNPAKATSVALQALFKPSSVSIKDKVFAKVWAKRAGTQLATYLGALTANAGIQAMITDDKEKRVNLLDPTKSDWLKFKFGNTTVDATSGMLSTLHFIEQMAYQSAFDESKQYHTTEEKSIGRTALRYGVGKLAPFYGDVAEGILRHDYNGNTMPWSDAKPLHNYNHKLTWEEYAESKLPLPVAEGFKTFYESAHANGMTKNQINNVLNGLQYGSISGLTGFKAYETKNKEGGDGGGAGATGSYSAPKTSSRITKIKRISHKHN